MIEHVIIATCRDDLDRVPAEIVARASAILVGEPHPDFENSVRYQVVKTRYTQFCGQTFATRSAALRAVLG